MTLALIVQGELEGMGHSIRCEVMTWKGAGQTYSRFRVIEASPNLPDGRYTLTLNGRAYPTQKHNGRWAMEVPSERE